MAVSMTVTDDNFVYLWIIYELIRIGKALSLSEWEKNMTGEINKWDKKVWYEPAAGDCGAHTQTI